MVTSQVTYYCDNVQNGSELWLFNMPKLERAECVF